MSVAKDSSHRGIAIAAIAGAVLLFVGTYLHPMTADPNNAVAAFEEYAADRHWIATHLLQSAGAASIVAALVLLGRVLAGGAAATVAALAGAGAVAALASAAALQAVDGVALKAMVAAWATAAPPTKDALFAAAYAVRQVEIGLATFASLLFGVTTALFGIALWIDRRFPRWLGAWAIVSGAGTVATGITIAYSGFSPQTMAIEMPSSVLLLLWLVALAVFSWRRAR